MFVKENLKEQMHQRGKQNARTSEKNDASFEGKLMGEKHLRRDNKDQENVGRAGPGTD